jgi:hypothetical protein
VPQHLEAMDRAEHCMDAVTKFCYETMTREVSQIVRRLVRLDRSGDKTSKAENGPKNMPVWNWAASNHLIRPGKARLSFAVYSSSYEDV